MDKKATLVLLLGGLVAFLLSPVAAAVGVRPMLEWEVRNLANNIVAKYFQNVDPVMLQAMAMIESSRNPRAFRLEAGINDASAGLMQTLLGTAQWMWDRGNRAMGKRPGKFEVLFDPKTSMYFGAAYVNTLLNWGGSHRSEEWIVRAYNGGPGNALSSATAHHWAKYKAAKFELEG